ncbi:MAG: hypothetical protein WA151_24145 [Desulfatirhabdiaceae bacterium]
MTEGRGVVDCNKDKHMMKKNTAQIILLLLLLVVFCFGIFLLVRDALQLPFAQTNESLHKRGSAFTLDRLIPAGTYIDGAMTIQDVMAIRLQQETSSFRDAFDSLTDLIPYPYRLIADLIQFCFWTFLWMVFFRIFTFMGYGRALRSSLLMGGILYYFMPDFSPGKMDDALFLFVPILIISIRGYLNRKNRQIMRQ